MERSQDVQRRIRARRSSLAGVAGMVLIGLGFVLTLTRLAGDVVPTILGILGVGSLMAGVSTGAMLLMDGYRFARRGPGDD